MLYDNAAYYMIQMFGRTIKCSIAKDNGRAAEFIRRKEYKDKSQCYECGVRHQFSSFCVPCLCRQVAREHLMGPFK